ncbi:MAG: hypothetical protein ACP5N1_04590 [Candidatus Woesearchaeota archaeon]
MKLLNKQTEQDIVIKLSPDYGSNTLRTREDLMLIKDKFYYIESTEFVK